MTRHIPIRLLALLCVLSTFVGAAFGGTLSRQYAPIVFGAPAGPSVVTLVESDTTFVSAAYDPVARRVYVGYIDRAHGNRAHFTELIGDALYDVALPAFPPGLAAAPAFSPPDSPKDADSAMLVIDGWAYWFVSSREVDQAGAPFKLKLYRFRPAPIPATATPAKVPGPAPTPAGPSLP